MPYPHAHSIVPKGKSWREELAEKSAKWARRNLDEIHQSIEDDVFARGLRGERIAPIARWYGAPRRDFELVYGDIWRLAYGQQQNESIVDMINEGRKSGIPVMKMMGHKVSLGIEGLATTVDDDQIETDSDSFQINVNVIRKGESTYGEDAE